MLRRRIPVTEWRNPDVLCNRKPGDTAHSYVLEALGKGACSACCMNGTTVIVNHEQRLAYQAAGTDVRILATNSPIKDWADIPPFPTALNADEERQLQLMRGKLRDGESVVMFIGRCGLLDVENKRCTVVKNSIRSRSCGELEEGSITCMEARHKAGYTDHTFGSGRMVIPQSMPD